MRVLAWDVGLRTLSYCLLEGTYQEEQEHVPITVVEWGIIDVQNDTENAETAPSRRVKAPTITVEESARMMIHTLHQRAHLADAPTHAVVIEQQPAGGHNRHSNVRIKVMSHVIQSYFYTRGIVQNVTPPVVTFVSPASKLVDMKNEKNKPEGEEKQTKYVQNKKYAVRKTAALLDTEVVCADSAKQTFEAARGKKDDLADAFLLGYYYLLKHEKPKRRKKAVKRKRPTD